MGLPSNRDYRKFVVRQDVPCSCEVANKFCKNKGVHEVIGFNDFDKNTGQKEPDMLKQQTKEQVVLCIIARAYSNLVKSGRAVYC